MAIALRALGISDTPRPPLVAWLLAAADRVVGLATILGWGSSAATLGSGWRY